MIDIFISTILSGYTNETGESRYNLLPMVFRVKDRNNLDLSSDLSGQEVIFPARARAKNLKLAERMRTYASYRPTR